MAITKLSKELKKLRIDHEINRATMAKTLKISDKALEAIELGKAEADNALLLLIAENFGGNDSDVKDITYGVLKEAQIESLPLVMFVMANLTLRQRQAVVALKDTIEEENRATIEIAATEAKKLKELKAAIKKDNAQAALLAVPLKRSSENYSEELAA